MSEVNEELREIAQEQMPYKDICAREKRGHQQCEDLCDPCLLRFKKVRGGMNE